MTIRFIAFDTAIADVPATATTNTEVLKGSKLCMAISVATRNTNAAPMTTINIL